MCVGTCAYVSVGAYVSVWVCTQLLRTDVNSLYPEGRNTGLAFYLLYSLLYFMVQNMSVHYLYDHKKEIFTEKNRKGNLLTFGTSSHNLEMTVHLHPAVMVHFLCQPGWATVPRHWVKYQSRSP